MAQRTVVTLTDDLDPDSEATQTVVFGLDGQAYEIDLNDENAGELRDALAPYIAVARRAGGRAPQQRRSRENRPANSKQGDEPSDVDTKAVRAWAQEHGIKVSARGRVSAEVLEKYRAAVG